MEKEFDPIEAQYKRLQDSKEQATKKTTKVEFNVKNYLDVKLNSKEKEKKITIRILPERENENENTPFSEVYMHYLPSKKRSYVCSKETQKLPEGVKRNCPFCDIKQEAIEQMKSADDVTYKKYRDVRNQNTANINYIVRVVDRDDESFGVKFWKITEPIYKLIYNLYEDNKADGINIFDLKEGKDLTVTIEKKDGKNKISSVTAKNKLTALADSEERIQELINDPKVWNNVYGIKTYEYLKIIIDGGEPFFDKSTNTWIHKTDVEKAEDDYEDQSVEEDGNEVDETSNVSDDLPF